MDKKIAIGQQYFLLELESREATDGCMQYR